MTRALLRVSDHALIRYFERVHGLDFEPMRAEIAEACARAAAAGEAVGMGHSMTISSPAANAKFIVAHRVVVTTLALHTPARTRP